MEIGRAIRIESLNIKLGQAGGLEAAIRALQQVNIRIIVLQEIKLTGGVHTHYSSG